MKIKCLSIKTPASYLICAGIKDVENRTWSTTYRGDLYIHSSGAATDIILFSVLTNPILTEYKKALDSVGDDGYVNYSKIKHSKVIKKIVQLQVMANDARGKKPFYQSSAIIGKVRLADVIKNSKSLWAIKGQCHWILKDAVLFDTPICFVRGKLGLWEYNLTEGDELWQKAWLQTSGVRAAR